MTIARAAPSAPRAMLSTSERSSSQVRAASMIRCSRAASSTSGMSTPLGIRTTKCSRASTDSLTRVVLSMFAPPKASSRIDSMRSRTVVL